MVYRWWLICSSLLFSVRFLMVSKRRTNPITDARWTDKEWLIRLLRCLRFLESCSGSRDMLDHGWSNLTRSKATFFPSDEMFTTFSFPHKIWFQYSKNLSKKKLLILKIYHNVLLFTSKVSSLTTRIRTNEMVGSCLLAWTRCGMFRRSSQLLRLHSSPIRSTHTLNVSYYQNNLSPIVLAHQRSSEGMTSIKIAIPTLPWWMEVADYAAVFWFRNDSFWQQLVSFQQDDARI